jgi:uncharacterized protein YuzE
MPANLKLKYDREGDILYIHRRAPHADQESEELGDDIIARIDARTGEIDSLEVLFFSTRLLRADLVDLPVEASLSLVASD